MLLAVLDGLCGQGVSSIELVGRAGVGAGQLRVSGTAAAQAMAVAHLRSHSEAVGHVVLLRADAQVKRDVDVWNLPVDAASLLHAVKGAFDPVGILNAGRGPV